MADAPELPNPLKDVPRAVIGSATLMFASAICAGFVWVVVSGFAEMRSKDQRSREAIEREREISRQDLDRELDRFQQERELAADWHRKGMENVASRLSTLTMKIDDLTTAVKRLQGKADLAFARAELLPMPREFRP